MDPDEEYKAFLKAWGDQAGARIRDVAREVIRCVRVAEVAGAAADFHLEGEGHVRVAYNGISDELFLVFPNTDRDTVLLDQHRLGVRRWHG